MKYKVGDRVKIKSLDWYNENSDDDYNVVFADGWHFSEPMSIFCGKDLIIEKISHATNPPHYMMKDNTFGWTDDMIEGHYEEENIDCEKCGLTRNSIRCLFMDNCPHNKQKNIIEIPEDYVIKDENGNIIDTHKIVLEKKNKYPKTYEECCKIIDYALTGETIIGYKTSLLRSFQKLLVCRDAYWKIAGEEMGLGKPWEPDYDSGVNKYGIICMNGVVQESNPTTNWERHLNKVLDFPTAEMRDTFKENFGPDIEFCKEFL